MVPSTIPPADVEAASNAYVRLISGSSQTHGEADYDRAYARKNSEMVAAFDKIQVRFGKVVPRCGVTFLCDFGYKRCGALVKPSPRVLTRENPTYRKFCNELAIQDCCLS